MKASINVPGSEFSSFIQGSQEIMGNFGLYTHFKNGTFFYKKIYFLPYEFDFRNSEIGIIDRYHMWISAENYALEGQTVIFLANPQTGELIYNNDGELKYYQTQLFNTQIQTVLKQNYEVYLYLFGNQQKLNIAEMSKGVKNYQAHILKIKSGCNSRQIYNNSTLMCDKCVGDQNESYSRIVGKLCSCPDGYYDVIGDSNCQSIIYKNAFQVVQLVNTLQIIAQKDVIHFVQKVFAINKLGNAQIVQIAIIQLVDNVLDVPKYVWIITNTFLFMKFKE
ncbi:hypothetical protein PPERSA_05439 [Pseudocohnilembus persalinus]|uniref:Insulin-like growth factor binding protein, N-terminal n=1 Tax=Pseudocohnilembus persalinus TaxID=266149 RepID=A0A0V0R814_PSEPJ|nr:hypothetical protein PPERSA_05439 [Pseudocohnilembus persalinus]|eukprot:KRX10619.1 hypothetical protein PPERSA_05439 [Pseudocohnilembus persalinus]